MGCIINWDDENTPKLDQLNVADGGCIVLWSAGGAEMENLSSLGGCFINWDSVADLRAAGANAKGGCIIDWDESTDLASLTRDQGVLGCIINWKGIDHGALQQAAQGGCIIDW